MLFGKRIQFVLVFVLLLVLLVLVEVEIFSVRRPLSHSLAAKCFLAGENNRVLFDPYEFSPQDIIYFVSW